MKHAKPVEGARHGGTDARAFSPATGGRGAANRFGPLVAVVATVVVIGLLATLAWSAVAGSAPAARHPTFFGGSLVLADNRPLISLDVATGTVDVQLAQVSSTVGAESYAQVQPVALDSGTLLVNRSSGNFNLLGADNFVVDPHSGGIGLGSLSGATGASGVADGTSAFIVRFAPRSTVSLVGVDTVNEAATAASTATPVAPLGFISLDGSVPNNPASMAAAGGSLTAVVDVGGAEHLERLDPAPAAALSSHTLAVLGPAGTPVAVEAVGSSDQANPADQTSTAVLASTAAPGEVAVASPGEVRLYPASGAPRSVAVPGTESATDIEAVTGATGQAWFLARSATAWSVFGVDAAGQVTGPSDLAIPVTSKLAEPAASGGYLYTMAQVAAGKPAPVAAGGAPAPASSSGQPALWVLDPVLGAVTTVAGYPTYPRASSSERASFAAAAVVTRGPRVIFDNPDSLLGVVVFTDGSRSPMVFDKANALTVSPQGPAVIAAPSSSHSPTPTAGSRKRSGSRQTPPEPTTTTTVAPTAPVVNQRVSCADTAQTPRAPQIAQTVPSAHSVLVSWTYPLLDQQDCEPDSWVITLQALNAPQPADPAQTESGQLQYTFVGLRPSVTYQVTVTAFINQQSTVSAPSSFATLATGADPPSAVSTVADRQGNWVVSWTPCSAATCYVPAATWVITGSSCGGFAAKPPAVDVDGSQTSVTISAKSLSLLGTSFSFEVQGVSALGLRGDPTSDHACTQAWQPPNPAAITVAGAAVVAGSTVTATVQVATVGDPTAAYGSRSTTFTYHVGTATAGPTTSTSVRILGLVPGAVYTPTVTVTPTAHPAAAVTISGKPFHENLAWPTNLAVSAQAGVDTDANLATIVATFTPALPVPVAVSGDVTCGEGSTSIGIPPQQLIDGRAVIPNVALTNLGGACSLSATLAEVSTTEFGVASPVVETTFNLGTPIDTSAMSATFAADSTFSDVQVQVAGDPVPDAGSNWVVAVSSPPLCTAVALGVPAGPPTFPLLLDLGPCADDTATGTVEPVVVTLGYRYLGDYVTSTLDVGGTAPMPTTTTTPAPPSTTTSSSTTTATIPPTVTSPTTVASGSSTTSTSSTIAAASEVPSSATAAALAARTASLGAPPGNGGSLTLGIGGLAGVGLTAAGVATTRRKNARRKSTPRKRRSRS